MAARTYHFRGYCTRASYLLLDQILCWLCDLGNAALQERRDAWRMCRKSISYKDQCRSLTGVRADEPQQLGAINTAVARGALKRIDRAFQAFFRRCKAGENPGYPRFRSRRRYRTVEVNDVRVNQVRTFGDTVLIRINGLPTITLKPSRPLPPGKPSALRIVRRACGCTVHLVYQEEPVVLPATGKSVGGDVGLRKRLTLSTGETMTPDAEDWKGIRRVQRAIARCERGSRSRRKRIVQLVRLRHRAAVVRRNSAHRMTSSLVARFDVISIEGSSHPQHDRLGRRHGGGAGPEREGEVRTQPFDSPAGVGSDRRAARLQGSMGR